MSSIPETPGSRLREILEAKRKEIAPGFPRDLLRDISEIEEQYQFDDERKRARQSLREAVTTVASSLRLRGGGDH